MLTNFDSHHTGYLAFDDYLRCCVTVQSLHKAFTHRQVAEESFVQLNLEMLLTMVMESRARPVQNLSFDES